MHWKVILLVLALAPSSLVVLGRTCLGLSHNGFMVYISPQTNSAKIGHTISVNITVSNVSASGLWAYEFKLCYDKSFLEPVSATIPPDHFLKPTLSSQNIVIINSGTINQTEGSVFFAATLIGAEPGKTGSGTLANVTFVLIAAGRSALTIAGYSTAQPKFVDGNGSFVPNTDYSLLEGSAEGLPLQPPPISPPPVTAGNQIMAFNFQGIYGYLVFPEEGHAKDTITHQLLVAVESDNIRLNFFHFNISCMTSAEILLHNETIEDENLPETWILNETISLTIPADASGKLNCIIEIEAYGQFTVCHSELNFYTTSVRTLTYEELQTAYQDLLNQYNATAKELEYWKAEYRMVNASYYDLLSIHEATANELHQWVGEYQELNNTYHELLSQHETTLEQLSYWTDEYMRLNSTYSQLHENYDFLSSIHQQLQADYNKLESSYDSLEANYLSLNWTYTMLQGNYEKLQTTYSDLEASYKWLNTAYRTLSMNYTNLMLSIEDLQQNLSLLQNKYDDLLNSYSSLNSTYCELLGEYENTELENNNTLTHEPWISRTLWVTFATTTVATSAYIVYSSRKKPKY